MLWSLVAAVILSTSGAPSTNRQNEPVYGLKAIDDPRRGLGANVIVETGGDDSQAGLQTTVRAGLEPGGSTALWLEDVAGRTKMARNGFEFVANDGSADPAVDYVALAGSYQAVLAGGAVALLPLDASHPGLASPSTDAVIMSVVGGSSAGEATVVSSDLVDPSTGSQGSQAISYADVLPGIDMVYSTDERDLEYNFIIEPGADPADITLAFDGADELTVRPDGTLAIDANSGPNFISTAPYSYQNIDGRPKTVQSAYVTRPDGSIGFELGPYDETFTLIIDPTLVATSVNGGVFSVPNTLLISAPSSAEYRDLLVAQVVYNEDPAVGSITPPAGWNTLNVSSHSTEHVIQAVYWRLATASEPSTYGFSLAGSGSEAAAAAIGVYRDVDINNPIDAWAVQEHAAGVTNLVAPSVTTGFDGAQLIALHGVRTDVLLTPDPSMTERWETAISNGAPTDGALAEAADEVLTSAGATGSRTATVGSSGGAIVHMVAIRSNCPADSDGDGLCDLEEDANTDADNDPATNPGPDTDGDSTPNYLDADDDGDGMPTSAENPDPNSDGDPRDARDSDRDGQPDWLDPPAATTGLKIDSEQKISALEGGLSATIDAGDDLGVALTAIGDLDGDGVNDLLVGAQPDDDGGPNRGAVYVLFLNADGTVKAEQKISDTAGGLSATLDDDDLFGSGAGIGDLDGDGVPDIAVGAYRDDDGGVDRGAVYVLFLNADGTVKAEQKISDTVGGLSATLDDGDRFGIELAGLGDLDGDGVNDIAVGSDFDDDGGVDRGAVYVLFLNADGTVKAEQKISDTVGGLSATLDDSDLFGRTVAVPGDIDGDGTNDLAVGIEGDDDGGTARGAILILLLNADGTVKAEQKISDTSGGFTPSLNDGDHFSIGIGAVGDLDLDGVPDLLAGSVGSDTGGSNRGAGYILLLNSDGTVKADRTIDALSSDFSGPLEGPDAFGSAAAGLGDLDGDGTISVAFGARHDSDGGAEAGAVWVFDLAPGSVTVNSSGNSGDSNPGDHSCTTGSTNSEGDPECTLRAAIEETNAEPGLNSILFDIPTSDPGYTAGPPSHWVIAPTGTALPALTGAALLDATTQPAWTADPVIELDGSAFGGGEDGLAADADKLTIRGMSITSWPDDAARTNRTGVTFARNWFGISIDGTAPGNGSSDLVLWGGATGVMVGGTNPDDRNRFAGRGSNDALVVNNTVNVEIRNNTFGLLGDGVTSTAPLRSAINHYNAATGTVVHGNRFTYNTLSTINQYSTGSLVITGNVFGLDENDDPAPIAHGALWLSADGPTRFGGAGAGEGNVITNAGARGISFPSGNATLTALGNSIHGNGAIGIDLNHDGVTANDVGDIDGGSNGSLNFPVITSSVDSTPVAVNFDLDVPAGDYRVEFFTNVAVDPSGYGEGETFEHAVTVTHTGSGVESFSTAFTRTGGPIVTATTTEDLGGGSYGASSEFSAGVSVCIDSDGDGLCDPYEAQFGDTDGDTIGNENDPDDDGDGVLTNAENADPNGDGNPRDALDADRDGQPDWIDEPTTQSPGTVGAVQKVSDTVGGLAAVLDDSDYFGSAVTSLGDLDGDGVVDVAVGAERDDDGGSTRGAVHVLFLNADGTVKGEQKISDTVGGFVAPLTNLDYFGSSVAGIGDLDGDGLGDLAVGAPYDDDGGSGQGAVYILFLNADGTVKAEQKISATSGGLTAALDPQDRFGTAISSPGDLDGDGVVDLAASAAGDDDGGVSRGAVYVLFLNADGTVKAEQKISDTVGGLVAALADADQFGESLSGIDDLDGDGIADLAVGTPWGDDGGVSRGEIHVLFLNADGTVKAEQKVSGISGGLTSQLADNDRFGIGVAAVGDLDLDGIDDLVVGSADDGPGSDRGALYVLFMNVDGTVKAEQKVSDQAGAFIGDLDDFDYFGHAVSGLGDLDSDGTVNLGVGAYGDDDGGTHRGAFYVIDLAPLPITLSVNSTADGSDATPGDGICHTGTNNSEGDPACTLRAAIEEGNAGPGATNVAFAIPTSDPGYSTGPTAFTITPASPYPQLTRPTLFDGRTQSQYLDRPVVVLDGSAAGSGTSALYFVAGTDDSAVRALAIHSFDQMAIRVADAANLVITGNLLGLDVDGTTARGNRYGVYTDTAPNLVFGGTTVTERNVISDNDWGVALYNDSTDAIFTGNYIGTDITGLLPRGNLRSGLFIVNNSARPRVGGSTAAEANVFGGNGDSGLYVTPGSGESAHIEGNFFGVGSDGVTPLANEFGVQVRSGQDVQVLDNTFGPADTALLFYNSDDAVVQGNFIGTDSSGSETWSYVDAAVVIDRFADDTLIGGTTAGQSNVIRNGGTAGVQLTALAPSGTSIIGNSILANTGPGIDLGADGVTANDAGDGDIGPNDLLNRPAISHTVENAPGTLTTTIELDVPAGNYRIELFRAAEAGGADDSDAGEGETLLGTQSIVHTGSGSETFVIAHPGVTGDVISATATVDLGAGDFGSTSEFSRARIALSTAQVAINDTGDATDASPGNGVCDTGSVNSEGEVACTLRAAVAEANASASLNEILFDMPITAVGYVAAPTPHWVIQPSGTELGVATVDLIDASTQPGWTADPVVQLDGSLFAGSEEAVRPNKDNMVLRGLSITNWPNHGVRTFRDGVRFESNWFGVAPTGITAGNGAYGLVVSGGAANVTVGGDSAAEGNVFAAAGTGSGLGVWSSSTGIDIANNRFGLGADGVTDLGPQSSGVSLWPGLSTTVRNNIFANHPSASIVVGDSSNDTVIVGNSFGLDDLGDPAPVASALWTDDSGSVTFGGSGAGEGNTVRNATAAGVHVDPVSTGVVTIIGNTIADSSGLGIDLGSDGVTTNDPGDIDSGPNDLLNYPNITRVTEAAGTVTVEYDLDVAAGDYRIEFYVNPSGANPSLYGGGEELAHVATNTHAGSGVESFSASFLGTPAAIVTALATQDLGGGNFGATSEFSLAVQVCHDPDGDGLCTRFETTFGDTDGDSIDNENDPDDDGDGTPTAAEGSDPDGDGNPRDAVDSDHDGQPDYLDGPTGATEPRVVFEQKISDTAGGLAASLDDNDSFGASSTAIGDLDGDGVVDLAVGSLLDDDGGPDRGAVYVLFLNADGSVKAEQKISDTDGGLVTALDDADHFGVDVANLGDLDGDGLGDILVGARYDDDGGNNAGAAYVLFLNADGTVKAEQKLSNGTGGFSGVLSTNDEFGHAVTGVGDIDGDGVNDAVVGAHGDSDGGPARGAVHVLLLNVDGTVKAEQKISSTQGSLAAVLDDGDEFGDAVSGVGDLNGDGRPEVIVGAFRDDDGGTDRGALYVLFLNADGTVASEQKISNATSPFLDLDNWDLFGKAAAGIGDLNRDGVADLAVAAVNDDDGGIDRGAVYLLMLRSDGSVGNASKISATSGGFVGPLSAGDQFGSGLAAVGDLDGDGQMNLVATIPSSDDGGPNRGAVYALDLGASITVQDASARRSHLTSDGGLDAEALTAGIVGDAVSFDGSNDRLIAPATDITSGLWSLSGWVNASTFGTDPRIAAKTASDGDTVYELLIDDSSSTSGVAVARLKLGVTTYTVSGGSLSSASWHHLAVDWDGAALSLYVDGALVDSTTATGAIATDLSVPLAVGNLAANDRPFAGRIDELRLTHGPTGPERVSFEYANVTSPSAVISVGAEQTSATTPWTVDGTQARSGSSAARAPELAAAGTDAWLTAVGIDEPGVEFTSWWWLSTDTGIDAAAGTRTGIAPTDQYETALTSVSGWDLATDVAGTRSQQAGPSGSPLTSQWVEVTIRTDESGNSAVLIDGTETIAATPQGSALLTGSIGLRAGLLPVGQAWFVDDARARKYLSVEPVASFGPLERN